MGKLSNHGRDRKDGVKPCSYCGMNKWKTVKAGKSWVCRGCKVFRKVKETA